MQSLETAGPIELLLVSLFLLALLVALIFVVVPGAASGNRYSGRRRVPEFSATEVLDTLRAS